MPKALEPPETPEVPAIDERTAETPTTTVTFAPAPPPEEMPHVPPAVSTSMRCIVNLVTQFFVVYTILFVVQTLNQLKIIKREREQKSLITVAETVFFVPMLCVLFLATRMRAVQLAHGKTEEYGLPQWWVQSAMVLCSWSVLAQTILVFVCTSLYGDTWEGRSRHESLGVAGRVLFFMRNASMFLIYLGFTIVCFGTVTMQAPEELWGRDGGPPISPAVQCTVFLAVMYFAVYLALAIAKASNEAGLMGPPQRFRPLQELLKTVTMPFAFVPMLCVLFIAIRMRALQIDPINGNPPRWVQASFYVCTVSLSAQALLAVFQGKDIVIGEGGHADVSPDSSSQRDVRQNVKCLEIGRMITMAFLYGGVLTAISGMFAIQAESGMGPDLPLVLHCVIDLTALYFLVYLAFWIVSLLQWFRGAGPATKEADGLQTLGEFLQKKAREAVRFCPIVCILFLATLMRALQITKGMGAPPEWCQNLAVVSTWCIALLTVSRFDTAFTAQNPTLTGACMILQFVVLAVLYASSIGVVIALFTMQPEDCTGPGATGVVFSVSSYSMKHPHHTVQRLRAAHPTTWRW
eukprot:TRINITY_DN8498_c0_g1_i2.p1 TRINITY_DN8498_c0_g1~~TRINITY_DN8498_c0_g1_i2.p1  ORF type:complete len:577 (+),score=90.80 TRINITY_DN8498_c0_g1_i2:250-1980(+)